MLTAVYLSRSLSLSLFMLLTNAIITLLDDLVDYFSKNLDKLLINGRMGSVSPAAAAAEARANNDRPDAFVVVAVETIALSEQRD